MLDTSSADDLLRPSLVLPKGGHLKLRYIFAACIGFIMQLEPATGQVQQDEQIAMLVEGVTKAFFEQLPQENFEAERAFMSDEFAAATPLIYWKSIREQFVKDVGQTPQYVPHKVTYYEKDSLLAAVDFSGQATKPDTFVCGFVLWEITKKNMIGFIRIEQNIVPVAVFKSMPIQQAAQLMTDWRCPVSLIEKVLEISVQ